MRPLLLLLAVAVILHAFPIVNQCNAPDEYVDSAVKYLKEAYDAYCRDVRCPALCPDFHVVLEDLGSYGGLAYTRGFPYTCTYKIEIDCKLGGLLKQIAYHEMAHALQAAYGVKDYGWWTEAHAEGLTSYYIAGDRWQYFGHVSRFWDRMLYRRNPNSYIDWSVEWYQYGAFFAWLSWWYSPRNATDVYADDINSMMRIYLNFLLSPWDWGRMPAFEDGCSAEELEPYTSRYCRYGTAGNYTYVIKSNVLVNAAVAGSTLYVALASPYRAYADYTVTVVRCRNVTVTATVTETKTETATATVRETETVTSTATFYVTSVVTTVIDRTVATTVTANVTHTVVERRFDVQSAVAVFVLSLVLAFLACIAAGRRLWR